MWGVFWCSTNQREEGLKSATGGGGNGLEMIVEQGGSRCLQRTLRVLLFVVGRCRNEEKWQQKIEGCLDGN